MLSNILNKENKKAALWAAFRLPVVASRQCLASTYSAHHQPKSQVRPGAGQSSLPLLRTSEVPRGTSEVWQVCQTGVKYVFIVGDGAARGTPASTFRCGRRQDVRE
ncbi:hypothetical protein MRX96_005612 [Rhipicephalus microplus]